LLKHTSLEFFNTGINPLRATLRDEIFTGDFAFWAVHFVNICVKTNKYTNDLLSLLIEEQSIACSSIENLSEGTSNVP
jgi:hypothetical protein